MTEKLIQVLLIEDNPTDALLVEGALTQVSTAEFKLTNVERLIKGLECLSQEPLDVVLLDLSLPDSQGLETLVKIREQAPQVPVVVLTGLTDEELGLRALQEGAQDYLVKGHFEGGGLARTIRYAIERKRSEAEIIQRNRELLALQSAGAAIASNLRLDDVYNTLAHHTRRLFPYFQHY
jgi:DNA-binding response OmpR family regulator